MEVVRYMEANNIPLDWQDAGSGRLLTLPTDEWDYHASALFSLVSAAQPASSTSALERRDTRGSVGGGGADGHPARWLCYSSGAWGYDAVVANFAVWNGITQIWIGEQERAENNNQPGDPMHVAYKLTMFAADTLTRQGCERVLGQLVNGFCQGSYADFHGGFFDVFRNKEGDDKIYSLHADPNSDVDGN
ncbi:hypothetical protein QBC34DRAFT_375389 [Podospora aff. communis PSN243]|uniref:Uncharacterized protein n=1 Tax=Podospora aff. communis PSN243 TaxID=3040156 RepID=A0AAV9H2E4_9PEZI|nr:hypothetical protein QBC34DRAFT_375389 [Podospora aff. communis PSN243]